MYALYFACVGLLASPTLAAKNKTFPYQNASLPTDTRVKDLLSRMTFGEKLAQLRNVGGILSANETYNATFVNAFNAPYGGGSICK